MEKVKLKPILCNTEMVRAILGNRKTVTRRVLKQQPPKDVMGTYEQMDDGSYQLKVAPYESIYDYEVKPPYQVGDILYVRETWGEIGGVDDREYIYRADDDMGTDRWHPSIHMPKEAARIFLRVTDVRIERLQDITEEQAKAEGIDTNNKTLSARCIFQYHLWNSTIKKSDLDKYSWNANPWVTVNEFERISKEEATK